MIKTWLKYLIIEKALNNALEITIKNFAVGKLLSIHDMKQMGRHQRFSYIKLQTFIDQDNGERIDDVTLILKNAWISYVDVDIMEVEMNCSDSTIIFSSVDDVKEHTSQLHTDYIAINPYTILLTDLMTWYINPAEIVDYKKCESFY